MLFFSQYWGARDYDGITRSYGLTLSFMMTVACIFTALALGAPGFVMNVYTDKQEIQSIGITYLRIVGFAYPLQVLAMAISALLRSIEQVKIPLYGGIASVAANCIFNYILIFGKCGLPRFPIICNELLIGVGNMMINIVLGHQIEQAIAAVAVFRTLEGLVIAFFSGFSNAATVLVGKKVGSGHHEIAYERAWRLVYLCNGLIGAACLVLIGIHNPLLHAMGLHDESYRIGTGMLFIYSIAAIIRMGNWVQNDTYRSAGDAAFGSIMEITFMYLMVLPCVYGANYGFRAPFLLIFALCYVDEPIRFIIMQCHMYSAKWIKPVSDAGLATIEEFRQHHRKT